MSDTYKGPVYHVEALDQFHIIVRDRKPAAESWVAVQTGDGLAVARYHNQPHLGLVRWLRPYRLPKNAKDLVRA